ncbi:MAG: CBS domain-containing protein [Acetobacteraceae bacterium]|nr:CBS domain-containing protein [Acetobacteraceae bacterium]MBV8522219.1 CBS domain-containing protein [Acetobacteraceae bacterium]
MDNRPMSQIVNRRQPVTLPPQATVQEACRVMRDQRIGAILITDESGNLLGIFTGRDAVCRVVAEARNPASTVLEEVMTRNPDSMPAELHAIDALRLMWDGGFRHVPVTKQGRLAGIVSRGDFRGLEQARLDEETGYWETLR